ncbi:ORF3 [torque teno Delphinidae virus 53]
MAALGRLQRSRRKLRAKRLREQFLHQYRRHGHVRRDVLGRGCAEAPACKGSNTTLQETSSTFRTRRIYTQTGGSRITKNLCGRTYTVGEETHSGPRDPPATAAAQRRLQTQTNENWGRALRELYGLCKKQPPVTPPYPHLANIRFSLR